MSNLIKLVVLMVVVVLGVIFRKKIHARSKKMYEWTRAYLAQRKFVKRISNRGKKEQRDCPQGECSGKVNYV